MTDTEKIVTKTKEFILNLRSEGLSNYQYMVNGLKGGIDYFVGRKDGIDTIKDEILATCLNEFDERTKEFNKIGHLKMVKSIRTQFVDFIKDLDLEKLSEVLPIPFERRLTDIESQKLENRLKSTFDFGSWKDENYYWEPISITQNKIPFIYFDYDIFKVDGIEKIIDILGSISGERIFVLSEFDTNYEIEPFLFNMKNSEKAYCDFGPDWLIYISHEGTITFSGQKLIEDIEKKMPEIIKYKNTYN